MAEPDGWDRSLPRVPALLLVVGSAALYSMSFPPLCWRPLAWVAVVPFLVAVAGTGPWRAAGLGLVWGVALAFGTAWWLPGMVVRYYEAAAWVGWAALLAVGILHAGVAYAVAAAWIAHRVRCGRAGPFGIAVAWAAAELLRCDVLGDPWALAGYSQIDWLPLMQMADVAGVYGVGMLVVAVNAVVAGWWEPRLRGERWRWSTASVVLGLVVALTYGRHRLAVGLPSASGFSAGIVQSGIGRGFRWQEAYRELGVSEHLTPSAALRAAGVDLLVWPEHAVSFYVQESTPAGTRLSAGLTALAADVVLGAPHYHAAAAVPTTYHNSVFLYRGGQYLARYDKQHLLPGAETHGRTHYTPGDGPGILPARVAPLGPLLCFEAMFPSLARRAVRAGAEVLVNLTNDSWFNDRSAARHHLEIARVRAIETRRPMVRAAATGHSAIIDAAGRVIVLTDVDVAATVMATVTAGQETTPYAGWGDLPLVGLIVAMALGSLATGRG